MGWLQRTSYLKQLERTSYLKQSYLKQSYLKQLERTSYLKQYGQTRAGCRGAGGWWERWEQPPSSCL